MKRPEFTREQEDWLCVTIGNWYLSWKNRISNSEHRLGYAKEELKMFICGENLHSIGIQGAINNFIEPREFVMYYSSWKCWVCKETRPNEFISVKVYDVSLEKGCDKEGIMFVNVKYCNDREVCIGDANIKELWINRH